MKLSTLLNEIYIDPKTREAHLDLERLDSYDIRQVIMVWAAIEAKKDYDQDVRKHQFDDEDDEYKYRPEPVLERAESIVSDFARFLNESRFDDRLEEIIKQLGYT